MPLSKQKKKLNKLIQQTDSDDSEHELSFYINDRVKLMKEVLKTIRPKKIKAMAPACLKSMDMEEINSMLLEELLGISNKRLKYIFNGQVLDEESSSSTNEDEPMDIISLDDISDDEFVINLDDDTDACNTKLKKVKKEHKHRKVKKEKYPVKQEKISSKGKEKHTGTDKQNTQVYSKAGIDSNENLMSVLELLELQARARAIKSQLLIEASTTQESITEVKTSTINDKMDSDDDVIIECTKTEEIIITSGESEDDTKTNTPKKPTFDAIKEVSVQKHSADKEETDTSKESGETCTLHHNLKDKLHTKFDISANIPNKISEDVSVAEFGNISKMDESRLGRVKIIENKEIPLGDINEDQINEPSGNESNTISKKIGNEEKEDNMKEIFDIKENKDKNRKGKQVDNDETIVINLSDYEMEELK